MRNGAGSRNMPLLVTPANLQNFTKKTCEREHVRVIYREHRARIEKNGTRVLILCMLILFKS